VPRTTLDLDAPILEDLKRLQKREKKSLGRLASDLLADALGRQGGRKPPPRPFAWKARPMGAKIDLADKDAVQAILDRR
jgi:hypothetical protein